MKIKIGVMASAEVAVAARLKNLLAELGAEIARRDCLLLTGATTGVPDAVSREARRHGCFTIGISPAHNAHEHATAYGLPTDGCDALIFTGFGLKGRNVVLVRSCDLVIVVAGGMGTLNEFTIAVDEAKVVGVLSGTGGVADDIGRLLPHVRQPEKVIIEAQPAKLLELCLRLRESQ
jgi:uncharacterized protein (TIGR00725 family)